MSNKTLEQELENKIQTTYGHTCSNCDDIDSQIAKENKIAFRDGVTWLYQNTHLLSPSDVAKIECVSLLIDTLEHCIEVFEMNKDYVNSKFCKARLNTSNFEPKKEGANE